MGKVRGFRFDGLALGPDAAAMQGSGLALTPTGRPALVEDDDAVRQAIITLLTTQPGERVMRPDYGCPMNRLMFSPNDATTAGLAIHYVRQALSRWEPRIEITHLDAGDGGGEAGRLAVSLEYRVRLTNQRGQLEMSLDLYGSAA